MARNGGHQAVGRAGSCFLDNSGHYTDQWFSFGKYKMAVYFYQYSSVSFVLLKPIRPVLNLNMGVTPHGQSLDLDILCVTYIESMGLKLTFYGDFNPNHNSLFQSLNKNLQAKYFLCTNNIRNINNELDKLVYQQSRIMSLRSVVPSLCT
jgi:hypothetical protein